MKTIPQLRLWRIGMFNKSRSELSTIQDFVDFYLPGAMQVFLDFPKSEGRVSHEKRENGYALLFELAGFKKEKIKVEYRNDFLHVTAESEKPNIIPSLYRKYHAKDNEDYEFSKSSAKFDNGLLEVLIPFKNSKNSSPVEIKIE